MALAELLRKAEAEPDRDTLREGVRVMTQALMKLEVAQHLGAERYQRSPERQGERNGYRDRNWDNTGGHDRAAGGTHTRRQLLPGSVGTRQAS
jgi:putative transposase